MGDREALAVGAGNTYPVDGTTYKLRPIPVRHLKELELRALREFRQEFLKTYADSVKMLGKRAQALIESKVDEAARWTLRDLPKIEVFDVGITEVNEAVKEWITENYSDNDKWEVGHVKSLLNRSLDAGLIDVGRCEKLTGLVPRRGLVRYDQWWVTASAYGMVLFVLSSLQIEQPGINEDVVSNWSMNDLAGMARIVEGLTTAEMGNG